MQDLDERVHLLVGIIECDVSESSSFRRLF